MEVLAFLKKLFPNPRIPQKRYLVIGGLALYWILKIYTASTPNKDDDIIPELIKDGVVKMVCDIAKDDDTPAV